MHERATSDAAPLSCVEMPRPHADNTT
jgi:hypothetical protein